MTYLIFAAVSILLVGVIVGYSIAPRIHKNQMLRAKFRAYCQGKLKVRNYRDEEIRQLQLRVWRLEAITRKIHNSDQVKA